MSTIIDRAPAHRRADNRTDQQDSRRKRVPVAYMKFGLAGVALLGIGAAATSAAWSDNAWFGANATVASVELQASLTGAPGDYTNADAAPGVTIPFELINAGSDISEPIYLRNAGTVPVTVGSPDVVATGFFVGSGTGALAPASVTVTDVADTELGVGESTTATVHVTTPDDWDSSFQSQTGSLTVTFTGQS